MGCGRVGATLATSLENRGHDVAVIDQDETAFRRLSKEFGGNRIKGELAVTPGLLTGAHPQHGQAQHSVQQPSVGGHRADPVARQR